MSSVLEQYLALREQGHAHYEACAVLAHRLRLDPDTVNRSVRRAQEEEQRLAHKQAAA